MFQVLSFDSRLLFAGLFENSRLGLLIGEFLTCAAFRDANVSIRQHTSFMHSFDI